MGYQNFIGDKMSEKVGLYVEIDKKVALKLTRTSEELVLPKNRIVEMALLDLMDKNPQLTLLPKNDFSNKKKSS